MRELLVLAAALVISAHAQSVCHVFSYNGDGCLSLSSSSTISSSCTTKSFCLPANACNTTLYAVGAIGSGNRERKRTVVLGYQASPNNVTGCIAIATGGQIACDGALHSLGTTDGTGYQCVCDDDHTSCPAGTAVSSNLGSSSSLSFTWIPHPTPTSAIASNVGQQVPSASSWSALTTFYATFTITPVTPTSTKTGINALANSTSSAGTTVTNAAAYKIGLSRVRADAVMVGIWGTVWLVSCLPLT